MGKLNTTLEITILNTIASCDNILEILVFECQGAEGERKWVIFNKGEDNEHEAKGSSYG